MLLNKNELSAIMKKAHVMTKKFVKLYHVNYRFQFSLCLKFMYSQFKAYAKETMEEHLRNILLTLNKLLITKDNRYDKYLKLYNKYNSEENIIRKAKNIISLDGYFKNSLGKKYIKLE